MILWFTTVMAWLIASLYIQIVWLVDTNEVKEVINETAEFEFYGECSDEVFARAIQIV